MLNQTHKASLTLAGNASRKGATGLSQVRRTRLEVDLTRSEPQMCICLVMRSMILASGDSPPAKYA